MPIESDKKQIAENTALSFNPEDINKLTFFEKKKLALIIKQMRDRAANDPIYFCDNFLRTHDATKNPSDLPFKLYPYQKRYIRRLLKCIDDGEDIFVDKTRQMGVTYTTLALFLWLWLFRPGFTALIGSRKQDLVDGRKGGEIGSKDESLFAKLGYMLERLPPFLLPLGFEKRKHFTYMTLINPENGSAITGESSNPNFSRGGNFSTILLDEFAFWDDGWAVWGATADSTKCRIVVTTPGKKPSKAKRLRFGLDGEKILIYPIPWKEHPEKNTAKWLDAEKERRGEEDFNREIMMDWGLSIKGRIYPELEKAQYGKFPFIPDEQLYVSGDYGLDGTVFLFWQRNPKNGKWRLIDSISYEEEPIEYSFPLWGKPIDSAFIYDSFFLRAIEEISKYPPAIHFGDPSINKRSGNKEKESDRDKLAKIGVYVISYTQDNSIDYRVKQTKIFLKNGLEVNESDRNYIALDMMKAYRWKQWDEDHESTATFRKPVHDSSSHFATSMEFMAVNILNFTQIDKSEPEPSSKQVFLTSRNRINRFRGR